MKDFERCQEYLEVYRWSKDKVHWSIKHCNNYPSSLVRTRETLMSNVLGTLLGQPEVRKEMGRLALPQSPTTSTAGIWRTIRPYINYTWQFSFSVIKNVDISQNN